MVGTVRRGKSRNISSSKRSTSLNKLSLSGANNFYSYTYFQEKEDIKNAIETLKEVKNNSDLKKKYQKYLVNA